MSNISRVFRVTAVDTKTKEVLLDAMTTVADSKSQAEAKIMAELVEDQDGRVSSKNAHLVRIWTEEVGTFQQASE